MSDRQLRKRTIEATTKRLERTNRINDISSDVDTSDAESIVLSLKQQKQETGESTPISNEINSQNQDLYCICRKPDNGTTMIQCHHCQEWFHVRCMGFSAARAKRLPEDWQCPICSGTLPEMQGLRSKSIMTAFHKERSCHVCNATCPSAPGGESVVYCSAKCALLDAERTVNEDGEVSGLGVETKPSHPSTPLASPIGDARSNVRRRLITELAAYYAQWQSHHRESESPFSSTLDMQSATQLTAFIGQLEEALYQWSLTNKPHQNSDRYKQKYMQLLTNLRDPENNSLRDRLFSGALTPLELMEMSAMALANKSLQAEYYRQSERALRDRVLTEVKPSEFVKKTHKGEVTLPSKTVEPTALSAGIHNAVSSNWVAVAKAEDLVVKLMEEEKESLMESTNEINQDLNQDWNPELPLEWPDSPKQEQEKKRERKERKTSVTFQTPLRLSRLLFQGQLELPGVMNECPFHLHSPSHATLPWDTWFLQKNLFIQGRLGRDKARDYLHGYVQQRATTKRLAVALLAPDLTLDPTGTRYRSLVEHLGNTQKVGVIAYQHTEIKDVYLLPYHWEEDVMLKEITYWMESNSVKSLRRLLTSSGWRFPWCLVLVLVFRGNHGGNAGSATSKTPMTPAYSNDNFTGYVPPAYATPAPYQPSYIPVQDQYIPPPLYPQQQQQLPPPPQQAPYYQPPYSNQWE